MERGLECRLAGRFKEAEAICQSIMTREGESFNAVHLLAVLAFDQGRLSEALELIARAIALQPQSPEAHRNLGEIERARGNLDASAAAFRSAIALNARYAEAFNGLGIILGLQGHHDEAISQFASAIACNSKYCVAYVNLGIAYQETGRIPQAVDAFKTAIANDPDFAIAYVKLGKALQALGRDGEALEAYQYALALDQTITEGHLLLGYMLHDQGMIKDALDCFNTALALDAEDVSARWAATMSQLALVHEREETASRSRDDFATKLNDLAAWITDGRGEKGEQAVGMQQPFYLAYHEVNNRQLLSRYGDLCCTLMGNWQRREHLTCKRTPERTKKRIGLVSGQIRNHSVWHAIVKGWVAHLDRRKFDFFLYHTSGSRDDQTSFAEANVEHFAQGPKSLREWAHQICADELDALIYPEIGMDPMALKLASMRLVPVQAAAWGHPETTGLSTIDYYLSAEEFEPSVADEHYREKLIRLPHLGCCYQPLPAYPLEVDFEELGIDPRLPILLCPGVPFKYVPQYDVVLVDIARELGRCQFVFFNHKRENLTEELAARLESVFEGAGLFFHAYAVFLPWLKRDAFYELMRRATVYLDTLGFSGFNGAMQAVECGLPVVTKEGAFMRGRLASGILTRIGMTELVAKSEKEYVHIAARVANDVRFREALKAKIVRHRDRLFDDLVPVRAFEEFLDMAIATQDGNI